MPVKQFITAGAGVPATTAPISQAVVAGNYCHVSGQIAVDEAGNFMPGSIQQEGQQAFRNLFAVVRAAGFSPADIVFIDAAFLHLEDLPAINALMEQLFDAERRPARTVYQAAALPAGARIKVLAVAIKG